MKRLISLLLVFSLLLPVFALAAEQEVTVEALDEDDFNVDEDGNLVLTEEEESLLPEDDLDKIEEFAEQFEIDETVDLKNLELNANLPDNVINVLLIGLDVRGTQEKKLLQEQEEYAKRADVQMILSINTDDGSIKLTSIARNTFVEIPGRRNKSIVANSYGHGNYDSNGKYKSWTDTPEVCLATVNRNFQMNIQYYVAINFYGVASIIESLGGVDVDLKKKEAKAVNDYLAKHKKAISRTYDDKKGNRDPLKVQDGTQHLDGIQALMYARLRSLKGENDLNRTGRTRHLLDCMLKSTVTRISGGELDLLDLLMNFIPYFKTNMNLQTIFSVATAVLGRFSLENLDSVSSMITEFRIPEDKTYHYDTANGASVTVLNNKQATTESLHNFIYGSYYPAN